MTAAWAGIAMTAQRSGAAAQNGPKRFELLKAKAGSIPIQKAIALHAKNVGHLEGRPNHFSFFRLKLGNRLIEAVLAGAGGEQVEPRLAPTPVLAQGLQ